MAPYLTPNIIRHAMAAMTGETMAGIARSAVMIGRPRATRLRRRASPSPRISSSTRDGAMMTAVFHTEPMKRGSLNRTSW